eukprot:4015474-Prymnesium_polylepis.1
MYVMPVHGADVLWPHTEFEAVLKGWDSKTSLRILKKKEEAKRLKTGAPWPGAARRCCAGTAPPCRSRVALCI